MSALRTTPKITVCSILSGTLAFDGAAGMDDVAAVLHAAKIVFVQGPSGLACAGTVPCP